MKKQLAICDSDEHYRQMMQCYLIKRLQDFEIVTFGSLIAAAEDSRQKPFAILLVSEQLYERDLQGIQALQTFILRENGAKVITQYPYIEKYQSMESLLGDIFADCVQEMTANTCICSKKARLHAFYSPVRKEEQTKAALGLGQVLLKSGKKVLYLNVQSFTGYEELLPASQSISMDITDLFFFLRKQEGAHIYRFQGMKQSLGGVDYLAPAADFMDLQAITQEEWLVFVDKLVQMGEYSEIILDLSEVCQGLYQILEQSDCIYSMCGVTDNQKNAVNQYKRLLEKRELSCILEKTGWIALSQECFERAMHLERLYATPLGEYMKGYIEENGNKQI